MSERFWKWVGIALFAPLFAFYAYEFISYQVAQFIWMNGG